VDFQDVGYRGMDWIELAQDRDGWRALVSAVTNICVPENAGNFLTSCKPVSFSRRTLLKGVSVYRIFHLKLATLNGDSAYSRPVLSEVFCINKLYKKKSLVTFSAFKLYRH
jgi:hypothetical protein